FGITIWDVWRLNELGFGEGGAHGDRRSGSSTPWPMRICDIQQLEQPRVQRSSPHAASIQHVAARKRPSRSSTSKGQQANHLHSFSS
ncbi:hypothetical protein VIGAN_11035900, partial [Vigna angularis var. angularis]